MESGYIRERKFEPAHWEGGYRTEYVLQTRCRTVYSNGTSSVQCGPETVPVSVWEERHEWVTDRWAFKLEECKPESSDKKPSCRTGWRSVTQQEYGRYKLGQHYPNPQ